LLLLALVNATPLAVSSTLFLFYVDLQTIDFMRPHASPLRCHRADLVGAGRQFGLKARAAGSDGAGGDVIGYTLRWARAIQSPLPSFCGLSGASIGADLTPRDVCSAHGDGIAQWRGKALGFAGEQADALAFAAALLLPCWNRVNFRSSGGSTARALTLLTWLCRRAMRAQITGNRAVIRDAFQGRLVGPVYKR
jgi:GPH family glycoside/pentoside/hexuronide:cation symporter